MPGPVHAPELFNKIIDLINEIEKTDKSSQGESNENNI